jgi:hypothetical protein
MKDNAVFHRAQAERSALIMSLDVDVGTGTLPEKWPTIDQGPERFACGLCDLPPLEDKMTKRICYVNEPPVRSLVPQATEIPVVNPANALMAAQVTEIPVANAANDMLAAQDGNTRTPDIQISKKTYSSSLHTRQSLQAISSRRHGRDLHARKCCALPIKKST